MKHVYNVWEIQSSELSQWYPIARFALTQTRHASTLGDGRHAVAKHHICSDKEEVVQHNTKNLLLNHLIISTCVVHIA